MLYNKAQTCVNVKEHEQREFYIKLKLEIKSKIQNNFTEL